MACQSEEILCLSFREEIEAKDVVHNEHHVGEDERGDEIILTRCIGMLDVAGDVVSHHKLCTVACVCVCVCVRERERERE